MTEDFSEHPNLVYYDTISPSCQNGTYLSLYICGPCIELIALNSLYPRILLDHLLLNFPVILDKEFEKMPEIF